jgi:hypothetical protein
MLDERIKANSLQDQDAEAKAYNKNVLTYLDVIRKYIDKLELMIYDEL